MHGNEDFAAIRQHSLQRGSESSRRRLDRFHPQPGPDGCGLKLTSTSFSQNDQRISPGQLSDPSRAVKNLTLSAGVDVRQHRGSKSS